MQSFCVSFGNSAPFDISLILYYVDESFLVTAVTDDYYDTFLWKNFKTKIIIYYLSINKK